MNNEPEVIDDLEIDPVISDDESQPTSEEHASVSDEVSEDALGDTQLGQHLGQLITEIRRDQESFRQAAPAGDGLDPDPFDPSKFTLDDPFGTGGSQQAAPSPMDGPGESEAADAMTVAESLDESGAGDDDASRAIAQLVSEIETALQRFTQAERLRADQIIAAKEAQVADQYRRLRNLATKVARQKAQIQEAKKELKAKLELADRLHIEFDGIRQLLNGKLGVLDQLEKEDEAAE